MPEGADTLTDLGEGDYLVRYQETDTTEASEVAAVKLKVVPKTGDQTAVGLYALALLLSAACLVSHLKRKYSV